MSVRRSVLVTGYSWMVAVASSARSFFFSLLFSFLSAFLEGVKGLLGLSPRCDLIG